MCFANLAVISEPKFIIKLTSKSALRCIKQLKCVLQRLKPFQKIGNMLKFHSVPVMPKTFYMSETADMCTFVYTVN